MGQKRLRLNSEWQRQKAPRNPLTKTKQKTRQEAEPIRNEPEPKTCGGPASAKALLALTRGGPCPPVVGSGLPAHRYVVPVNFGPAPTLKADVGFTGVPKRVKSCSSASAEGCACGRAAGRTEAKRPQSRTEAVAGDTKGLPIRITQVPPSSVFGARPMARFAPRPRASHQP